MPLTVFFDEHGDIHFERHPFPPSSPAPPPRPPVEAVNPCERAQDPVDVAKLPSMPMEGRADLPLLSAVYFVLAPCRECHVHHDVQYIGKAATLTGRHRSTAHHRTTDFEAIEDARIAWMEVPKADLFDREQEMKDWFRPRLNDTPVPLDRQERALLQVRLLPELVDAVREWARGSAQSQSDMIAEMIRFWEQRHQERSINHDLHTMLGAHDAMLQSQVAVNQGVQTTLARIETLLARIIRHEDNGTAA